MQQDLASDTTAQQLITCVKLPKTDSSTGPIASMGLSVYGKAPRAGDSLLPPSLHIRSRSIAVHCCMRRVTPAVPLLATCFRGLLPPDIYC